MCHQFVEYAFQSTHPVRGATIQRIHVNLPLTISIHAPREGCDGGYWRVHMAKDLFQSTHPVRGATRPTQMTPGTRLFQSTHPVRGATIRGRRRNLHLRISIHAPREGCDRLHVVDGVGDLISIHAPREGCDRLVRQVVVASTISIHAPREGCDRSGSRSRRGTGYFNPRTP